MERDPASVGYRYPLEELEAKLRQTGSSEWGGGAGRFLPARGIGTAPVAGPVSCGGCESNVEPTALFSKSGDGRDTCILTNISALSNWWLVQCTLNISRV